MKHKLVLANIVNVEADALIYSTNVQLAMTGGVGAALKNKFGFEAQMSLVEAAKQSKQLQPNAGDIYITRLGKAPYKLIFNTIATTENFYTNPDTVEDILRRCLQHCIQQQNISSVVCSPIGSGFGDLSSRTYCERLKAVLADYENCAIQEFIVACYDQQQFNELCDLLPDWEQAVLEKPRFFFEGRKGKKR